MLDLFHNCRTDHHYDKQAFMEFLVSPALISNLNVHKSVGLSHVKCKILTYLFVTSFIGSLSSDRVFREVSRTK